MIREKSSYWEDSRGLTFGLLAVIPLLLLYEAGVVLFRSGQEANLVGQILKAPLQRLFGTQHAFLVLNGALILILVLIAGRLTDRGRLRFGLFAGLFLESLVYAFLLGRLTLLGVEAVGMELSVDRSRLVEGLLFSVGAGVYEELMFRLALLGFMLHLLVDFYEFDRVFSMVLSIVVASALFSLAHFVVEPFTREAFFFRFLAGLLLSVLYCTRGLAVAVYTHAIYDCFRVIEEFY